MHTTRKIGLNREAAGGGDTTDIKVGGRGVLVFPGVEGFERCPTEEEEARGL